MDTLETSNSEVFGEEATHTSNRTLHFPKINYTHLSSSPPVWGSSPSSGVFSPSSCKCEYTIHIRNIFTVTTAVLWNHITVTHSMGFPTYHWASRSKPMHLIIQLETRVKCIHLALEWKRSGGYWAYRRLCRVSSKTSLVLRIYELFVHQQFLVMKISKLDILQN